MGKLFPDELLESRLQEDEELDGVWDFFKRLIRLLTFGLGVSEIGEFRSGKLV